jgi:hypothetical protein
MFHESEHLAAKVDSTSKRTQTSKRTALSILILLASIGRGSQAANASTSAGFDGPAELPRILIQTAMANTPAPGITTTVNGGGNLQAALNSASCGDTILLEAGATFTGFFFFPKKNCDNSHWIIVRTSSDDSLLPAEGSRLTPCYAGVSSLPGRPGFNCTVTKNVLAKLVMNRRGPGPVIFAAGANHYRLIGLELTRSQGTGFLPALATHPTGAITSNIIYDRLWFHGTAQDDTTRGVQLGGSTYVSVIDSFFTDFHCVAGGSCSDSQAINGGISNQPMGPYKIVNNFLEAASENILFGGGWATHTPSDIQISHNYMFKPLTWMKGRPGFVGGRNGTPFSVKNLFELKNAQRVLLDGNIMENTWGGFSQAGYSILLTPKNPSSATPCPTCMVTDVTVRYNYISHMGGGMQISNTPSDVGTLPRDGGRYSIHDDVFDDINEETYRGPGAFAQVSTAPHAPVLHDVTINHVTAFPKKILLLIGDVLSINPAMSNFVFANSILNAGAYPVWSTGAGGTLNCAVHDSPLITFNECFGSYVFSHNALISIPSLAPVTAWPAQNFFPAPAAAVQFVNFNGGSGGNYQLQSASPYKRAGTDGRDLGADVFAISGAVARVR